MRVGTSTITHVLSQSLEFVSIPCIGVDYNVLGSDRPGVIILVRILL